jgi:thioredoxin 1
MRCFLLLSVVLLFFGCKKEELQQEESVHEPVVGLNAIMSLSDITTKTSSGVSLIFFHASWCSVCQAQRPAVTEVATDQELSEVFFGEVEYDDYPDILEYYNVEGFPVIVVLKNGAEVSRLNGGGYTSADIKNLVLENL